VAAIELETVTVPDEFHLLPSKEVPRKWSKNTKVLSPLLYALASDFP
jgi:hypothetical protein